MKRCPYCGQEYPDEASECAIDKQPLPGTGLPKLPVPPLENAIQHKREVGLKSFRHPLVITGFILTIFAVFVLLDAVPSRAWSETSIGVIIGLCGWLFRRAGISDKPKRLTWLRFLVIALPTLPVSYVFGYFVLMDRSRPPDPASVEHFYSSLRWAPFSLDPRGQPRPYPDVTIFNIIFNPADKIYFKWFPRSDEDIQRLKSLGYYR